MAAISQTTFSNAFSWMKMLEYRFKISLKFAPQGPINNIPALDQWWLDYRRIYASFGLNELKAQSNKHIITNHYISESLATRWIAGSHTSYQIQNFQNLNRIFECQSQRTHGVIITSSLRQNYVAASFWRNNDVIVTLCVRWGNTSVLSGRISDN